jgi:hypothetical protein
MEGDGLAGAVFRCIQEMDIDNRMSVSSNQENPCWCLKLLFPLLILEMYPCPSYESCGSSCWALYYLWVVLHMTYLLSSLCSLKRVVSWKIANAWVRCYDSCINILFWVVEVQCILAFLAGTPYSCLLAILKSLEGIIPKEGFVAARVVLLSLMYLGVSHLRGYETSERICNMKHSSVHYDENYRPFLHSPDIEWYTEQIGERGSRAVCACRSERKQRGPQGTNLTS